jgi:two-component system sensor histidine kinase SenX3
MVRSLKRIRSNSETTGAFVTPQMEELLNVLDIASVILSPGEVPVYYSPNAIALGVIRDEKLVGDELHALIRSVRRSGKSQNGTIEIPLGPIGEGTRKLSVKVSQLTDYDLTVAFFSDESEAERIDAVRRDFVANISHELKTPISALRTLSDAVSVAASDPQVVKFATMMSNEVERLSHLVQEIIDLSRLQDADPLLDAITVDIDEAIDSAVDQCQFLADGRDIEIVRGDRTHASVVGDRTHLIMAFHNLIENAINYSPDKTKVTVNSKVENSIVEVTVVDQGVGISDSDINRIFERFYRVDPARSRETGGTGLGLSIVKHVIAKHGGEVSVWSSSGIGSTFAIRLPLGEDVINEGDRA